MDEFGGPSGAPPAEEDFSKLPIEDRLKHKNWKARSSAYEELSKSFAKTASEDEPIFRTYTRNAELLKGMVTDANAVAQEKGIATVAEFLRYGGKAAGGTRETVLPSVVEKGLGSTRAGTKKTALEVVLLYAETEDIMGSDAVVSDVIAGLSAKQPKLVASSVTALKDLIAEFGPKQVSPKLILKKLPDIFGHADKTVRAEGQLLAQELHRYLGTALEPTLDTLKEIQAKELRAQFQQMDAEAKGKPVPPRNLISQKAAAEARLAAASSATGGSREASGSAAAAGVPADGGSTLDGGDDFDPYEDADPVDPMTTKHWPSNFDEQVKSAKWSERKDAFEAAKTALSSSIKLSLSPAFDSFVDVCVERIKKDVTAPVWLMACQCLEVAATGSRTNFAKYRERTVPPMLEKLKEKKQSTVDVLAATLDAIFQTVTFSDILEDILTATKHKNPNVKTESIRFLARCLRTTKKPPSKNDIKPIADALLAACSDGSGDVRDAGTQGLGTLMKLIGERPMNPYLDQLDDIKKAKVQEEYKQATVKVKMGGPTAAAASSRPAPAAARPAVAAAVSKPRVVARPSPADKENAPPFASTSSASPAKPVARAMPASRPAAPIAKKVAAPAPAAKPAARPMAAGKGVLASKGALSVNEPVKFRFTQEEAEGKAAETIPAAITAQLADSNWKERLAGIQALASWVDREAETIESELIVRALAKKPGWKESNFQVLGEAFKIFSLLASSCPTFGRATVAVSIQPLCDKLGDIKLKKPAGDSLSAYAEKTSFGFVLKQALGPLAALKAPKAIADSLAWINESLLEFGTQGVDMKSLVDFLLTCLKSANAAVRNNAISTMGTLARYLGPALNGLLGDLNPTLKSTIESEVDKAQSNPAPAPVKFSAELRPAGGAEGGQDGGASDGGAAAAAAEEDALEAMIPRVDIDRLLPSSAISNMGDPNWKVRKESLEEIQTVVSANPRLKGTLSDLTPALKLRYADSNLMCKNLALDIAAKLATAMGPNFDSPARIIVAPITLCLSDAKAPLRQTAANTLTAIADAVGAACMISGFAAALEGKGVNPMMKQDLFTWLAARFQSHPPDKSYDLAPLALHAVQCLDDKLAAVKKAALATLPYIIQRAGYKFVASQADGMKVASKNTVTPLIEQARTAANALGPAKGPAAPVAAPAANAAIRRIAPATATGRTASPAPRSASPAVSDSPQKAGLARTNGVRPPSAATRALPGVGGRIAAPSASASAASNGSSGVARPVFSSKIGAAKKAVMTNTGASGGYTTAGEGEKGCPFLTSDGKYKLARQKKESRGQHWIGPEGTPRPELVEILRGQCDHHVGAGVIAWMFSKDHNAERDYLSALSLFSDFISSPSFAEEEFVVSQNEAVARVIANSDLIFKYLAIRLTDNNTSISLKCFDVLSHLIDLLRGGEYHMSDYEATCILPCLIAKLGDAKVAFRDRIRDAFRKLTFIYPPSKLMTQYIDNGLPSKNARTRTECLGELGYLFSKNGLQVCTPSKTLPVIAKQIADRDTNVRTAALLALGECYKIVGDEIWGLVGKMPEKEMSLLEERLKRTTVSKPTGPRQSALPTPASPRSGLPAPKSRIPSGIPSAGAAASAKSRLPGTSRIGGSRSSVAGGVATSSPPPSPHRGPPGAGSRSRLVSAQALTLNGGAAMDDAPEELPDKDNEEQAAEESRIEEDEFGQPSIPRTIQEIVSSSNEKSTAALKAIHNELQGNAAPFAKHADQMATALAQQYGRAFLSGAVEDTANARLKKYLIQVSSSLFDAKLRAKDGTTLASQIQQRSLGAIMTQMLQCLIDSSNKAKEDEEAKMYATYLNKIVIRCFGSCNLNTLYATSFTMLADAAEDLRELSELALKTRVDFAELIIKCLWKVGRRLPTCLEERLVDPGMLMMDTETFLQRIPPQEWKARAQDEVALGDLPLRTVKVILSHIVNAFGEDVLSLFDKIQDPEATIIYGYMVRMLNHSAANGGTEEEKHLDDLDDGPASATATATAPASSSTSTAPQRATAAAASKAEPSADSDALSTELSSIFSRISQKDQSRLAIRDLYIFQKNHPQKAAHIERSLQGTGPIFQRYIKRALANHASEDEGLGTTDAVADAASASASASPHSRTVSISSSSAGYSRPQSSATATSTGAAAGGGGGAAEDRLAQLRAKFYNRTSTAPPPPPPSGGQAASKANEEID